MKKELLSPAGDFLTLKQAIHNGCDAVYLGGKKFGARKFASNFDDMEMIDAIKYCHLYGVKIYVTVNTVIYDSEVQSFLDYVTFLHQNGVDAVIMQDLGMISLVRKVLPDLDVHASTQINTHNLEQIKFLENLGVKRVVLARELSLDEIKKLDTNLEIEVFIHGALCVCYSGECLFSSLLLNRSGNRGECAGICRLPFTLLEDSKEVKTDGKYLLSTKELNTTSHIRELLDSNITSFKIEGRMKSPTTIGFITKLYRMLIDHYEKNEEVVLTFKEQEELMLLFNRGFTDGYLFNKSGSSLMNISSPNHIGIEIGKVVDVNKKRIKIKLDKDLNQGDGIRFKEENIGMMVNFIYDKNDKLIAKACKSSIIELDNKIGLTKKCIVLKTIDSLLIKRLENYEEKKIKISMKVCAHLGGSFKLTITDGINVVEVMDDITSKAVKGGTSSERIKEQLEKLGDTPFILTDISLDISPDIFVPISKINELRRKAISELKDLRENSRKKVIIKEEEKLEKKIINCKPEIVALVRNEDELLACLEESVDLVYVTDYLLYKKYSNLANVYLTLPRVISSYKDYENKKLLVNDIGSIYKYANNNYLTANYYLNITNSYLVNLFRNLNVKNICLSVEAKKEDVYSIISKVGNYGIEVLVYGRVEVMIMKYCPLKMLINKDNDKCCVCRNGKTYHLKDRNGSVYPLIQENELTHIFNYNCVNLLDDLDDFKEMGLTRYRLDFFDESYEDVKKLLKKIKNVLQ